MGCGGTTKRSPGNLYLSLTGGWRRTTAWNAWGSGLRLRVREGVLSNVRRVGELAGSD